VGAMGPEFPFIPTSSHYILTFGTENKMSLAFPKMVKGGEAIARLGMTEPHSGSI